MASHETDVAVIGAGPVGLFAVFQCGMLQVSCHVIDSLEVVGGQCATLYPEKPIYDIPGYPEIAAEALVAQLTAQAEPFAPQFHLGQQVTKLTPDAAGTGWRLETSQGSVILARAVIIAAGCGAFGPNRPPLANIESFEGRSVFYLVQRRRDFAGKRLVIAGGGDSAVDWAISLADVADKIYVVHRRPKFRAAPESAARLEKLAEDGKVELVIPYQLHGLDGDGGRLSAVVVSTVKGETRSLDADVLLPFFGLSTELGPIADWGLALDHHQIEVDPADCQTNLPGIFAIGDIAAYPNKLKLILCGFSEAAMAAHAIYKRLHPDEALHWEYSTTKGLPAKAGD